MLTIRDAQMREFHRVDTEEFERSMAAELRRHYPVLGRLHSEPQLLAMVTGGRSAADFYGVTNRREVRLFIHLSVMLGAGFSNDPLLPWARRILLLDDPPEQRMPRLYDVAMEYLDVTVGAGGVLPERAFRRLYELDLAAVTSGSGSAEDLRGLVGSACAGLWPEKYGYVKPENWNRLVDIGLVRARRYGIHAPDAGYYLVLSFVCGHAFDADPQYHWLAPVLRDPHCGVRAKTEELSATVRTVLAQVFASTLLR